jgi:hypothetical protein
MTSFVSNRWVDLQSCTISLPDGSRQSTARRLSARGSEVLASPLTPSTPGRKRILVRSQQRPNTAPCGSYRATPRMTDLSMAVDWSALYASYVALKPLVKPRPASIPEGASDTTLPPPSQPASPLRRAPWSAPSARTTGPAPSPPPQTRCPRLSQAVPAAGSSGSRRPLSADLWQGRVVSRDSPTRCPGTSPLHPHHHPPAMRICVAD